MLHRDPDTYRYIPASIRQYPGAEAVARLMEARGFTRVRYYPVLGGLMAIHHARFETDIDTRTGRAKATFTQLLIDRCSDVRRRRARPRRRRAGDADREADYNFISNEIFVGVRDVRSRRERYQRFGVSAGDADRRREGR